MKTLQTLIKIHKRDLDDKRRELVALEEQKAELLEFSKQMKEELAAESELASADPSMSLTFNNYRNMIKNRQATIAGILSELKVKMDSLSYAISEIYGEVKKYEIILQQKIDKKTQEEKSQENKVLDEVAINGYLNREN